MKRSAPVLALCLAAVVQVGALVSPASAHGTSAGPSAGAMAPLIIVAGIICFALYHFLMGRK